MSMRWTVPQQSAIEHVRGDLLVSAAAGSGKTAVLAERCARLVCETREEDGGCGVEGLLVLTFTEAAANEMRGRIADAIRDKLKAPCPRGIEESRRLRRQAAMVDRASISTLHGFCARVLRQHFHAAQIDPSFEVIDEDEARLMREEVLADLLARWHAQNPPTKNPDSAFGEFMEAYAQGRESTCREIILRVYRMLSSTADPAAYVAGARALYSPEGCARTLDRFVRGTLVGQLRLLSLTARRAVAEVTSAVGAGPMLAGLQEAGRVIEQGQAELLEQGAAALPAVRRALAYTWPRLSAIKDISDFDSLKKRTWQHVKDQMKALCGDSLAADAQGLLKDLGGLAKPLDTLLALVDDFIAAYAAAKRAQNRLDFSDLERFTLNVLTAANSLAAAELRARYCHLLVDEFQDINPLQAALLERLRSADRFAGAGNLFVVGDVKQSIYGFRLAEPALFLEREKAARASDRPAARRYVGLPHNFRSHPNLLSAMNGFFDKLLTYEMTGITYSDGHALQPPPAGAAGERAAESADSSLLNGSPVELHLVVMQEEEDDDHAEAEAAEDQGETPVLENLSAVEEEARLVADRIAALMAEKRTLKTKDGKTRDLKYRDIAILLRSMKDKAMIFARALARRGIRVHADLSTGYFDTAEVQGTLALLQVLDNPQQDIPLATALLGPYGRFSHDDVAALRLTYDRKLVAFPAAVMRYGEDARRIGSVPDAGRNPPPYNPDLAARLGGFLQKVAGWRSRLRTRPLHEGLAEIFADSRIMPYLAGLDAGAQRVANLQALHQRALKFAGFRKQGLHRFLRFIEKLRDQEGDFGEAPVLSEASDVVRIMSVHRSKGQEFPVVFVSGLGGMLNLIDTGPVYVHRDLFIGLQVADVERNIFYHSAASASIVDANRRTGRAEELRLLYVALTRARDHLILTGHINKAEELSAAGNHWKAHAGPLPEDVLLKGNTFLKWLLPALGCCGLKTQWPGEELGKDAQVTVSLHSARKTPLAAAEMPVDRRDETVRRLLAAEPLAESAGADPAVARLLVRVTGKYAHEALARQAAVMTVSELKLLADEEDRGGEEFPATPLLMHRAAAPDRARADASRRRGIATHRILELLDFAACATGEAVMEQIQKWVACARISADDAARADLPGILWFVTQSACGRRLREAETGRASGDMSIELRREIPFAWAAPVDGVRAADDPADWPTIRGVIDVLLVDPRAREAEIFDYKTDSAFTWEMNAQGYERQMRYYLRAASDILGFPVKRATLLFLAPREERPITLD